MTDTNDFNVAYCLVSKTFTAQVGVLSKQEIGSFFATLEGNKNTDWCVHCNRVIVEWSNVWNVVDPITNHSTFRLIPSDSIPKATFTNRQAKFNATPSNDTNNTPAESFDKSTQRIAGEDDITFEHRIIRTLFVTINAVKQHIAAKIKETKKMTINPFDKKIFYFDDVRILYSINALKILVSEKVTAPDSIIRIAEGLSFRAGDVIKHATPLFSDLLSLAIDEPITP